MRVLTIIDSLAVGGAERSLATAAPHLIAYGVELHVAYIRDRPGVGDDLVAAGATLHSLTGTESWLPAIGRARKLLKTVQPQVVHTTLYRADIIGRSAAALGRIPTVSSFVTESYGPEHYNNPEYVKWKVRGAHFADATTARFVTRFHAVSHAAASVMAKRLHVKPSKIVVIPRGRDPRVLGKRTATRRSAARDSLGIGDDELIVLAVARHYQVKGLDIAINAFAGVVAALPHVRLIIAGREGPATAELLHSIEQLNIANAVEMIGHRQDVSDLMTAADVFVLPSRAEGSPGALIEAMALEVPTVASAIPSIVEVAGGATPTSRLYELDAIEDLTQAIVELLEDPSAARSMALAARQRFEQSYSIEAVAAATYRLYEDVLADR